ncbi:MAG TPA: universal stress protein [Rhizobacter sp.]|nr:universal stress protein [Rhizobacter sp.]
MLGSHGNSALVSLVLGSVVAGVMARCKTPVLIIR